MTLFGQSGAPSFNEGASSTFATSYQFAKLTTNNNPETIKVAALLESAPFQMNKKIHLKTRQLITQGTFDPTPIGR